MNNIRIANQTIKITREGCYQLDGKSVEFPKKDLTAVKVISPEDGEKLLSEDITEFTLAGA